MFRPDASFEFGCPSFRGLVSAKRDSDFLTLVARLLRGWVFVRAKGRGGGNNLPFGKLFARLGLCSPLLPHPPLVVKMNPPKVTPWRRNCGARRLSWRAVSGLLLRFSRWMRLPGTYGHWQSKIARTIWKRGLLQVLPNNFAPDATHAAHHGRRPTFAIPQNCPNRGRVFGQI